MCNLVIKLQVSYQFSRRGSQTALQEQGHQNNIPAQQPQQHRRIPSQLNTASAAAQTRAADLAAVQSQAAVASPSGYPTPSYDPSSSTTGHQSSVGHQSSAEWRHHTSSMALAPSHQPSRAPSLQSWQHHSASAAQGPNQEPSSARDFSAEPAPAWPEAQRSSHAQPQASRRPSSLWGFAASGVDLQQHPAVSQHAQQGPACAGHERSSPARVGRASAAHEGTHPSELLPHATSVSHLLPSCSRGSGQGGAIDTAGSPQLGPEQDQGMGVERGGRQRQGGRWAPAKLVRGMMTRARRNRHED